jgi:PhnB protein
VTAPVSTAASTVAEHVAGTALVPYIAVRGAAAAIDWYRRVFGAREEVRYTGDDGSIGHAQLTIGGAALMLSDEYLEYGAASPEHLGGSSVALHLDVPDVDAVFARAVAAGATVRREPADQPYGERSCQFVDPWGHRWMVQTTVATPTVDEINASMDGFTVTVPDPEPEGAAMHDPDADDPEAADPDARE